MRKSNVIGDHAREGNLATVRVSAETKRVLDAFFDAGSRYAGYPIRVIRQKSVDHGYIEPLSIRRDFD
jgi:hypothetical protein